MGNQSLADPPDTRSWNHYECAHQTEVWRRSVFLEEGHRSGWKFVGRFG